MLSTVSPTSGVGMVYLTEGVFHNIGGDDNARRVEWNSRNDKIVVKYDFEDHEFPLYFLQTQSVTPIRE